MNNYLDPAKSLITAFGGGDLRQGVSVVETITGRDRTNIYRWMRPKDEGGTGGIIPRKAFLELEPAGKDLGIEVPHTVLLPSSDQPTPDSQTTHQG